MAIHAGEKPAYDRWSFMWWEDALEFARRRALRTGVRQQVKRHHSFWAVTSR